MLRRTQPGCSRDSARHVEGREGIEFDLGVEEGEEGTPRGRDAEASSEADNRHGGGAQGFPVKRAVVSVEELVQARPP